ncbi:LLM class flavin-dependent oxidoreductase [Streptomyces sp. MST-110588]|uniref:LLM class flavin-dependent oxidoreductase n=1 Tax=Streptomyces sp. MST-110588 TaxID=2833628 RepID=UPI001F5C0FA7|nr:LLM class flavin-dependent oxidoreductase [Streptomyces sp. MST-110588]UNO42880.1 LLM class flavin-dependent oxidoreductase [Streptomyces sp. MST-110588]
MPVLRRPLHLAAALDGPGGPERDEPGHHVRLARLAERGTLDFVTLGDSFGRPGPDALAVLARAAVLTGRIGLVPTVTTSHTEPFHLFTAISTLERLSRGRAGWTIDVPAPPTETAPPGRRPAAPATSTTSAEELWRETTEATAAATQLRTVRTDDVATHDVPPEHVPERGNRPLAGFQDTPLPIFGPSSVPRSPQGHPVIAVDATEEVVRDLAATRADVAFVRAEDPETAGAVRRDLRARARAHGRDPDRLLVLASLPVELYTSGDAVGLADLIGDWYADGAADGFHIRPADPVRDLPLLVDGTVPVLQHRCLLRRFYPGATLREHLGLPRPAGRHTTPPTRSAQKESTPPPTHEETPRENPARKEEPILR